MALGGGGEVGRRKVNLLGVNTLVVAPEVDVGDEGEEAMAGGCGGGGSASGQDALLDANGRR